MSEVSTLPVTLTLSTAKPSVLLVASSAACVCPPSTMPQTAVTTEERGEGNRAGIARQDVLAVHQRAREARRPPQRPRQDDRPGGTAMAVRAARSSRLPAAYRKHDASSTIQLRNSPKEWPAWAASSGTSDVAVIPGWVLISSQMISPPSEKRSS